MRVWAWPLVKLLCPFAGCGALAFVVATAWLSLPEAAAVPFVPAVVPVAAVPGVGAPVVAAPVVAAPVRGAVVAGMVVLLWLGGVVCAAATPRLSAAAAAPMASAFME